MIEELDLKHPLKRIGLVAIGRNEGERLKKCLTTLPSELSTIVYVDSDSKDDSILFSKQLGIEVVSLDMSIPFTAARARNKGLEHLLSVAPDIEFIQFIDGDCEVVPDWFTAALDVFDNENDIVAICGRRKERYPLKTPYNCICDVEWRVPPIGVVKSFGGDVMIRVSSIIEVKGYNSSIIAAEDDELSYRITQQCGKIIRLDQVCTLHDADITKFSQWWKRAKRCGHGYAQIHSLYGKTPSHYFQREIRSSIFWGSFLPILIISMSILINYLIVFLFSVYPFLILRNYQYTRKNGFNKRESILWGLSCVGAKTPQFLGIMTFFKRNTTSEEFSIIEYK